MPSKRRAYRRRTGYVPQDERNLVLEPILNDPVNMSDLVDALLIQAISKGLSSEVGAAEHLAIGRRFPTSRVPRLVRPVLFGPVPMMRSQPDIDSVCS
jgi:hypothetical protein